jgi:hypothetical protein
MEINPPDEVRQAICTCLFYSSLTFCREHLFRVHYTENQCARCEKQFPSEKDLKTHHKARRACEPVDTVHNDKMTEYQYRKVKGRSQTGNENDKWYDIYKRLFEDDDLPTSPCKTHEKM